MSTPPQLREETALLAAAAVDEFRSLLTDLPDELVRELLFDLLPGLVVAYRDAAAEIAAEWYDANRGAQGVAGGFEAFLPDLRDPGVEALIGWAESEARSDLTRLSLIEGGLIKRVENAGRETIIGVTDADPQGEGFQRYARTNAAGCEFCKMLAGRGFVYRTATSSAFAAHDSCQCVAVPKFTGAAVQVRPYTPSLKRSTPADRARVRAWIRDHPAA